MREILFRGKVVKHPDWTEMNGKWAVGFFVNALDEYPDDPDKERIPEIVSLEANNICCGEYSFYETYEVDPDTVSQYTGVVDKNGRMIFEGDILKCELYDGVLYSIGYSDSSFNYRVIGGQYSITYPIDDCECGMVPDMYEVIGNIWDNPELLEVK